MALPRALQVGRLRGVVGVYIKTCGTGLRLRSRNVAPQQPTTVATVCAGVENATCNVMPITVDCEFTQSDWGTCSRVCGGGVQHKHAIISAFAKYGGVACPIVPMATRVQHACLPFCHVGVWNEWTML